MRTWIATVANFFLPGAGYLVNGQRIAVAVPLIIGAVGLTYVELSLKGGELYWPMFAAVLVMNTGLALDAFREGRALEAQR